MGQCFDAYGRLENWWTDEDRAEFAAESFSTLYQRSLYQAMRGAAGRMLQQLRRRRVSTS